MGYENVDPATLQTLLGSPPVATYDGSAVATSGFGVSARSHLIDSRPPDPAVHAADNVPSAAPIRGVKRLFASFAMHMMAEDFFSAAADLDEISAHLRQGPAHWRRYVREEVE